jgi:hypothetical protein
MDATRKQGLPKQLRGRSLGTKLSEAEYAQCEKSAARRGQTLSEWCRQALLDAVAGPAPRPEAEVILSEILALRKIVINLLYGDKAGEPLSEERMRELIEAADSEKLRKAAERLHAVVTARAGVLSDDEPRESVRKPPGDRAASGGVAE